MIPPQPTANVALGGNITAGTATMQTLAQTVYDSTGVAHTLQIQIDLSQPTPYPVTVTDLADATVTGSGTLGFLAGAFDPATSSTAPPAGSTPLQVTLTGETLPITVDLSGLRMFGGPKSFGVTSADGYASGTLQQFQIGSDGSVLGVFSNDQKLVLAQLALGNFNNPAGLEKLGNSTYRSTSNSGIPMVGVANSGGRGQLLGGALEMSNVDLAREFTNLIIAQRGFQANSRVITTSDQMLQDLVDLKR
jgi:flagellar hook protein FlgE